MIVTEAHVVARAVNTMRAALTDALDTLLQAGVDEDDAMATMGRVHTIAIKGDWRATVTAADMVDH